MINEDILKNLKISCCFCNTTIESTDIDPCNISIMANYDKELDDEPQQFFYCHFACLKERLHSYHRGYFLESTFSLKKIDDDNDEACH